MIKFRLYVFSRNIPERLLEAFTVSSLMVCDMSVPVLVHCDHALSVMAAGLRQHEVLFLTVIRSFVRIHLETMQILLCSYSVFSSLTYFYMVGVRDFCFTQSALSV